MKKILNRLKKHKIRNIITLTVALLAMGSFLYIKHLANSPALGTVALNTDISNQYETTTKALKTFSSDYFSFQYPARYSLQTNQNKSASIASWNLIAHQVIGEGPGSIISVTISNVPKGGVTEDSAYKLFSAFPDRYKLTKPTINKDEVVIAEQVSPSYGRVALWAHGKYLATFSLTSGQQNDLLVNELDTILKNVQWLP